MKVVNVAMVFIVCAVGLFGCADKAKMKGDAPGTAVVPAAAPGTTISAILKSAGAPLTADQEKQIKAINAQSGRESFRTINEVFTDKQTEALKAVYGSSPGRDGGPERPRYLFFAVIFENENCPLSADQLTKLNALPNDRGAFEQMGAIFTEQQQAVMQKMFNR